MCKKENDKLGKIYAMYVAQNVTIPNIGRFYNLTLVKRKYEKIWATHL